jgi:hypothetical protein
MRDDQGEAIRDFIQARPAEDLARAGVLQRDQRFGYLLKGASLEPLLKLMRREGVTRLHQGAQWELHADGRVRNAWGGQHALTSYASLRSPGSAFEGANERINPYYRSPASAAATARPDSALAAFAIEEAIFTAEDLSKPENRCNLAIFHLLAEESFHRWFTGRLGLPATATLYPRRNHSGARPDLVAHDDAGNVLGVVEVELGDADAEQMANYASKYAVVFLITGKPSPGSHLSLAEIRTHFIEALPGMKNRQQALSAKYLVQLIADSLGGNVRNQRAPVSEVTLTHPFIARLVELLSGCAPAPGARGPTPGRLYWDTVKDEGFSLKAYSLRGGDRRLSLLARSGGRETVIFQSQEKYLTYLGHKPAAARQWCEFIVGTLGIPIDALEINQRTEQPMHSVEPHLAELAARIRELA